MAVTTVLKDVQFHGLPPGPGYLRWQCCGGTEGGGGGGGGPSGPDSAGGATGWLAEVGGGSGEIGYF